MSPAKRRLQPDAALATTVPLPPGKAVGLDGRIIVSVQVGASLPFAKACLDILRLRDGRDHSYKLAWGSFWVPEDVPALAREQLEADAAGEEIRL